jgi:hypothetical protein
MFTEKMARLTSDFTSRILDVLRAASLNELTTRVKPAPARAAKTSAPRKGAAKKTVPTAKTKAPAKKTAAPARAAAVPEREVTAAALTYFMERGRKGATADQLRAHLAELGLPSEADVIGVLAEQGAIRDAGFRRSTGTGNKTTSVFVAAT